MMILGPAIGLVAYLLLLTHAALPGQATPTLAEALVQFQQLPGRLMTALLTFALGLLCGASGFFLVIANLVIHFLGQDAGSTPPSGMFRQTTPAPQPPAPAIPNDSRYMPRPH
ncbi:MAG TPA: hypothetical protein VNZ64_22480 [Candidatus Acidoferrum sp.]|nr:hypothetical protein [Candidatus Acidoferrum sp.]